MTTKEYELYSGDSSYKYVDKLIYADNSELLIVSPYISNFYTEKLINIAQKRSVRVITSNSSLGYENSLIKGFTNHSITGYLKTIAFLIIIDIISVFLNFNYTTAIITGMIIITALLAYRRYKRTDSNLKVKVINDKFVHEKLYIGDQTAITGSANLTFNGMHKNIEHIEVTKDLDKINELKSHFENLWAK